MSLLHQLPAQTMATAVAAVRPLLLGLNKRNHCPASRPTLKLQKKCKTEADRGLLPPWVFAHEIQNFGELQRLQQQVTLETGTGVRPQDGRLSPLAVNVVDSDSGGYLGCGLFHSRPLIAARLLEGVSASTALNAEYLGLKLREAAARRRGLPPDALDPAAEAAANREHQGCHAPSQTQQPALPAVCRGFYRLINGESIELLSAPLVAAIQEALRPSAMVLRNDSLLRQIERDASMQLYSALISGELSGWQWIKEGGCSFPVDLLNSPDTGEG
ncbi:hypothetical protein EPH_0005920 [Eimeria praecox]|uniref:Uncharacterized protein n=1 Tax=Eimeria praecox TaxID=51316 RepID=U6GAJ7_9EIME|nr:hypothetical protein EPH_0005920 [Eimeria praecox]